MNIDVGKLDKVNESYDAITVTPKGSIVGVNMNINRYYEGRYNVSDNLLK